MDAEQETEWQAPPPPAHIPEEPDETPEMSEASTLVNIFIEPERTFDDLRRKPRFLLASLLIAFFVTAYSFGLYNAVGDDGMRRFILEQLDKNPQTQNLSSDQKENAIKLQLVIAKITRYATPVFVFIALFVGGLLYWLAGKAFGGTQGLLSGVSVWVYSSLPPSVVGGIASLIVLAMKSADEIDLAASQRGMIHANPSMFMGSGTSPVIMTLLGTIDLFMIWGWVLAAIGLRVVNKLSSASAWTIVLIFMLIGLVFRLVFAMISGTAL